jgi:hypothetical protein
VAVGDTLSDIGTLSMVERPIAFNPDQQLLAHAFDNNWSVVVERKNVVYGLSPEGGRYALDPRSLGSRRPEGRWAPQPADAARWTGPLDSVPLGCA